MLASFAADGLAQPADGIAIQILRTSDNDSSTTEELFVNGRFVAHTLEKPWEKNRSFISSIPPGNYGGFVRLERDNVFALEFWRIELTGTEPRTNIQIHKGNFPSDVKGCIIVGERVVNRENRLEATAAAFDRLKTYFPNYSTGENLNISVSVQYGVSQTIIRIKNGSTEYFIYAGDGVWLRKSRFPTSNNIRYVENYRDDSKIVISGTQWPYPSTRIDMVWRLPLHGGRYYTQINGAAWTDAGAASREN